MKNLDESFKDWEAHVFGFGYGTGEQHIIPHLKRFLFECPIDGPYDFNKLESAVGPTATWFLINALCNADLIEYGSSPRYGWLSKQGVKLKEYVDSKSDLDLLDAIQGSSDDMICYPDYCNCDGCNNPFWIDARKDASEARKAVA